MIVEEVCGRGRNPSLVGEQENKRHPAWRIDICIPRNREGKEGSLSPAWAQWAQFRPKL